MMVDISGDTAGIHNAERGFHDGLSVMSRSHSRHEARSVT